MGRGVCGQWAVDKGHGQGGVWTEGGVHLSPEIATAAVGAHPTGRHSCFFLFQETRSEWRVSEVQREDFPALATAVLLDIELHKSVLLYLNKLKKTNIRCKVESVKVHLY